MKPKLSLQRHFYRAEHWSSSAGQLRSRLAWKSTLSTKMNRLISRSAVFIALQIRAKLPCQVGSYLGEDDVVRLHDEYGRKLMA